MILKTGPFWIFRITGQAYGEATTKGILEHMKEFILELGGKDFIYMGSQYPLEVDGEIYKIDLLFFTEVYNVSPVWS